MNFTNWRFPPQVKDWGERERERESSSTSSRKGKEREGGEGILTFYARGSFSFYSPTHTHTQPGMQDREGEEKEGAVQGLLPLATLWRRGYKGGRRKREGTFNRTDDEQRFPGNFKGKISVKDKVAFLLSRMYGIDDGRKRGRSLVCLMGYVPNVFFLGT